MSIDEHKRRVLEAALDWHSRGVIDEIKARLSILARPSSTRTCIRLARAGIWAGVPRLGTLTGIHHSVSV